MIGINRNNYHSDASFSAPPSFHPPIIPFPLKFEDINCLEEHLDFYEIVSLVFLLYDNADTALSQLAIAKVTADETGKEVGLISDWVRSVQHNNQKWQETLLEALTNVQCYAALKKLVSFPEVLKSIIFTGFPKVEMNERFLPLNYDCTINLHPVKKALYRLCEDLSKDVIKILVETVNFETQSSAFLIENQFLEMHILHWITKRYINIAYDNTNDLTNLLNILGQLNMRLICIRLEMSVKRANIMYEDLQCTNELLVTAFEKKLTLDKSKENRDSMMSLCSYYDIEESKRYPMNSTNAGLVIVINQKKFKPDNFEDRLGTDFDRDRLIQVWKMYGFKVVVHEDLCYLDIQIKIEESINKDFLPSHCCLVVVILSHGEKGVILGVDGKGANINIIANKINNNRKLLGKPKILMIQACQGNKKERAIVLNETSENEIENYDDDQHLVFDAPSNSREPTAMRNADFCKIVATCPGYTSVRDTKKGSWLIQSFCDVLEKDGARYHFEDMILTTKRVIIGKRWSGTGMVPTVDSNTLSKQLYFIPVNANDTDTNTS